jgi:hypothetical protein
MTSISPDAPVEDISEMLVLTMRITGLSPLEPPPTLTDIERLKVHVIRMRLHGYLSQEIALRLLDRADLRASTLNPPQVNDER